MRYFNFKFANNPNSHRFHSRASWCGPRRATPPGGKLLQESSIMMSERPSRVARTDRLNAAIAFAVGKSCFDTSCRAQRDFPYGCDSLASGPPGATLEVACLLVDPCRTLFLSFLASPLKTAPSRNTDTHSEHLRFHFPPFFVHTLPWWSGFFERVLLFR